LLAEQPSRLSPLGTWWANVLLRQAGAVAPVVGEPGVVEDTDSLDPASARVLMAETLALVLRDAGPAGLVEHLGQLGPPAEQVAVLADLWRGRTPGVAAVLEAAGKAHPDPQVAKAARKAAFKLRSPEPQ
jgi:hypothetical protein